MKVRTSYQFVSIFQQRYNEGRRKPVKVSRQTELKFELPFAIADLVLISVGHKSSLTVLIIINKKSEKKKENHRSKIVTYY